MIHPDRRGCRRRFDLISFRAMDGRELRLRKRDMRSAMRARLSSLDDTARRAAGEGLAVLLREWEGWSEVRTVFSFLSTAEEIDTAPIHRLALFHGKALGLPRIRENALTFHRVRRPAAIRSKNRYAIREPSAALPSVTADARTLILVPGMAFDRSGRRLGRGGGYYDRFLAEMGWATTIGLCHSSQIVDRVPAGPNDVAVRWVATDLEIFEAGK